VTAVVFLGNLLMIYTERLGGLPSWRGAQAHMMAVGRVDWTLLARVALAELLLKYGWMFALAFAIGWWHRRRRPAAYGLTRGGRPLSRLLVVGLVVAGPAGLIPYGLELLGRLVPAGAAPSSLRPSHSSPEYLVYMAVASFIVAPILEELIARGYMQTRLAEELGPGAAILLVAVFFAVAHGDFLQPSLSGAGETLGIFVGAVLLGYVFHRTGSLVPSIVAHGLLNFPYPDRHLAVLVTLVGLMTLVPLVFARPVARWAAGLGRLLAGVDSPQATAAGALFLTLALLLVVYYREAAGGTAVGLLVLTLMLEARDRLRPVRAAPPKRLPEPAPEALPASAETLDPTARAIHEGPEAPEEPEDPGDPAV
jgi:membrane protease YdiL (CAAX protease family)